MNPVSLFIRRHVLSVMLSAVLVLFGVISYQRLGVDRYPDIEFPLVSVVTTMPGANPEIIDSSITSIVESAVNAVPGIRHIRSKSSPGVSVVVVQFNLRKDIDVAFNEVQAKVNRIKRELPDDADTPQVSKVEFGAIPIIWLVLQGDRTLQELGLYARRVIRKRLENIDGVGEVRIAGNRERTIRVHLDPVKMAAHGITSQDVVLAFQGQHFQMPGGFVVGTDRELLLKLDLEYHRPERLGGMIVGWRNGAPIRISDIGRVEDGLGDARRLATYNGRPAIGLGIVKVKGANAVAVIEEVKRRVREEILPQLPAGMTLKVASDDSRLILERVNALKEHLLLGTVLAALVIWLFLKSLRATFIVSTAIPVSLMGAVAVMFFFGYTFNSLTLLALLLLIGVVVDDAIVVLENIHRHMERKLEATPREAAEKGGAQVIFAVMATTLTLVAIFAPVIFMEGIIGRFFRSFSVVVTFGVLVSFLVSLTLTPMLCARWLRVGGSHGRIHDLLEGAFRGMERAYTALLRGALRARWLVVLLTVLAMLPAGFFMNHLGKGFLPKEDEGRFTISFKTPLGSSLAYTAGRLREIEKVLRRHLEIDGYFSTIGSGTTRQVNRGEVFVRLKPREERSKHMYRTIDELRAELAAIPGVRAFPSPVSAIGGDRGEPLQFVLTGPNLEKVAELSHRLNERLLRHSELGRVDLDLQLDLPQLVPLIDRTRAASLGIQPRDIAMALNILAGGYDVAKYNDDPGDGERYDIRLKAGRGQIRGLRDLDRIHLRTASGKMVKLGALVKMKETLGPAVVSRHDLQYAAFFYATPTISLGDATKIVEREAAEILPTGYRVGMIGRAEEFGRTASAIIFVLATSVILVFMVLASQFNSYIQPFVLMLAQPLAIIGGLAGLWLTGLSLNIFSMIGLVLLMGLVAKNSILLIEFTNQLRARGRGVDEALLEACPIRLRPVLMTSLTIIFSMLPAALGFGAGADTNAPLAVAIIGGMVSSTLLTLLVVPTAYSLVENAVARLRRRSGRKRTAARD